MNHPEPVPDRLRKFRLKHRIRLIELAAATGLPADYIEKIEEEQIVVLESDLTRLREALIELQQERGGPA